MFLKHKAIMFVPNFRRKSMLKGSVQENIKCHASFRTQKEGK